MSNISSVPLSDDLKDGIEEYQMSLDFGTTPNHLK